MDETRKQATALHFQPLNQGSRRSLLNDRGAGTVQSERTSELKYVEGLSGDLKLASLTVDDFEGAFDA